MKTAGKIILAFAILSFFGAAMKGHSVFGPCFWIAVGAFLLYRGSNKEETDNTNVCQASSIPTTEEPHIPSTPEHIGSIHNDLSQKQKEAILCMISFFAGFDEGIAYSEQTELILKQACVFTGLPFTKQNMERILSQNDNGEKIVDTVRSIQNTKAKEFLVLSCYDLSKQAYNSEVINFVYKLGTDIGFNKPYIDRLIQLYS